MKIRFRKAEIGDLMFLDELEKLSFPSHRQNNLKSLRLSIISPFQQVIIAEVKKKGRYAGAADAVLYIYRKTLRIFSIAVMPEYRGAGIGHELMLKIREIALEKGCLSISLEADADDQTLVNWYKRHGYTVKETLNDYYAPGESAVRMTIPVRKEPDIPSDPDRALVRNFIVVDNTSKWSLPVETAEVISAREYITDLRFQNINNAKIFNMCGSYRYQSLGYYVSLLASARDHRAMPNITTIKDLTNLAIIRNIADDIEELIKSTLNDLSVSQYVLDICFGQTTVKKMQKLAKEIYQLFESPLLRVSFVKNKEWNIKKISPLPLSAIEIYDMKEIQEFAVRYFSQKRFRRTRLKYYKYDLALLTDPDEKYPPSDLKALEHFIKAAEETGFYTEFITRKDYDRLSEFDALFIRETTTVNDHTYLFARRAYSEGLVVIDDPWSIMRCSNKMYLYERMNRNRINTPETRMLTKGVKIEKQLEGMNYPLVLKQPDGSFSKGIYKVNDLKELKEKLNLMYSGSDLIVCQEFIRSEYDWRIGVLDGAPLYACKYYMARDHWQIYNWASEGNEELHTGDFETFPPDHVPPQVLRTALKACELIGDGFYGADIKEADGKVYVIEINDNPNIDSGVEDAVLGRELYLRVMRSLYNRIEKQRGEPRYVTI